MNFIKKYTSRSLWLAGLLTTALMAGCLGDGSSPASPTVVEQEPIVGAVALNSKVHVTFNEEMDASTITTESFTVKGKDETALVGTVAYDAASKTATFTPNSNFTANTEYTATVTTAVKNTSGTALATNYTSTFTSGATPDTTAPTVLSTSPKDASIDFPLNSNVTANFSEAIDPVTVNSTSFTLMQGNNTVAGSVSYSKKVATFNPTNNLNPEVLYTATLSTAVTDLAGNALVANKVWTFTTGDTATLANGPAPVNLRTAGDFAILAKTAISKTGTAGTSITGDIGVSPAALSYITGFSTTNDSTNTFATSTFVTGKIYAADLAVPTPTKMTTAISDMELAYTDAAGRTTPDFTELHAGEIGGKTLVPGLYKWGTDVKISAGTNVTLNGGANDVWIFQIAGDIIQANGT